MELNTGNKAWYFKHTVNPVLRRHAWDREINIKFAMREQEKSDHLIQVTA